MTREEKAIRNEQMKVYKAEGHTMAEVAERFGVKKCTVQMICKGIAPQKRPVVNLRNQYTNGTFDRIENCKRIIESTNPNLEYFGGFKDTDSPVDVRCKTCGHVFSRSMITLRHKRTTCPACEEAKKQQEAEAKKKIKEDELAKKKEASRITKIKKAKSIQLTMKVCECCGEVFVSSGCRNKYCSEICSKRVMNAINKDRRLKKLRAQIKDRGITLEGLVERDNCRCALCGELCDVNDYYYRGSTFIAGESYPSIDHIVPLSMGGEHSWNNIQLAHRNCNTRKSNKIYPPMRERA